MSTTIALNVERHAVTQYLDFQYDGMCEFMGVPLGANADGVFRLDSKDAKVNWDFTLATSNYQSPALKRFRNVLIEGIITDDFAVQINEKTYNVKVAEKIFHPRTYKVAAHRNGTKDTFFSVTLSSNTGGFIAVTGIDATIVILSTKPRR